MTPYCKDERGFGPCWEQSLFEDNAEFAYGYLHAQDAIQKEIIIRLNSLKEQGVCVPEIDAYLANYKDGKKSREVSDALLAALEKAEQTEEVKFVLQNREFVSKSPYGPSVVTATRRYRLQPCRPCYWPVTWRQYPRRRYRSLLQYRRPVFPNLPDRLSAQGNLPLAAKFVGRKTSVPLP